VAATTSIELLARHPENPQAAKRTSLLAKSPCAISYAPSIELRNTSVGNPRSFFLKTVQTKIALGPAHGPDRRRSRPRPEPMPLLAARTWEMNQLWQGINQQADVSIASKIIFLQSEAELEALKRIVTAYLNRRLQGAQSPSRWPNGRLDPQAGRIPLLRRCPIARSSITLAKVSSDDDGQKSIREKRFWPHQIPSAASQLATKTRGRKHFEQTRSMS